MVVHRHALAHETLGAAEPNAALVGEQLTHGTHATRAEVVDIIDNADTPLQTHEILGRSDNIATLKDTLLEIRLETEFLVDLVAAHATQIVAFGIKEESLEQGLRIRRGWRLTRTQALIDFLEGFLLIASRILLQGANDGAFVDRRVDDTQGRYIMFLESTNDGLSERFERSGQNNPLLGIDGILNEHERRHVLHVKRL